jgi:hypothetical protein
MIYINHAKKAIYIHIPKTAGTYIGKMLVTHYGFISYLDMLLNKRKDHDIFCKSYRYKKVLTNNTLYDNSYFNKYAGLLTYCKTSKDINKALNMDEEKWETYFKFCFIRNPYDRALSGWKHFDTVFELKGDFYNYISRHPIEDAVSDIEYGHIFMSQKRQIEDVDGTCGVDAIGKFETLEEDFVKILQKMGFHRVLHIPKKINVSNKDNAETILLETKTIKRLNELFEDDLQCFHYKKLNV